MGIGHKAMLIPRKPHDAAFTIVELLIVIVVIGILAAITIVAYSGISNQAKQTTFLSDVAQWKKASELHKIQSNIECPENYVFVYGNATLGTSDFCIMKYEAVDVGGVPVSQADGAPWLGVSQATAALAAAAVGGRLPSDAEWMTVAADVMSVKYNWSGGEVGSGYLYQGHVNNDPATAIAASTDDSETLHGITGGTGDAPGSNSSRVLYLKSGDAIWDFSGNAWEWTSHTQVMSQVGNSASSAFGWYEWTNSNLSMGNLPLASQPDTLSSVPGLEGAGSWDSDQGLGQVYANYVDTNNRAFLRGGNWNAPGRGGVLTLHLGLSASSVPGGAGFRVAR